MKNRYFIFFRNDGACGRRPAGRAFAALSLPNSLSLLVFLFALSVLLFPSDRAENKNRKPFYFAPPETIKRFSFGFQELYADILWMRLLQNIDFCSSQKGLPVYDGKTKFHCEKGWSFKMSSSITELAPHYLKPYQISGSIMSIIMGDKQGAKIIYDKALKNFPDNWKIHFSAGYHYLMELKEEERAARLLRRSADLGGPHWLYALSAQTYSRVGKLLLSREILLQAIETDSTGQYREALQKRLKELQQEIQNSKTPLNPKTPIGDSRDSA